MKTSSYFSSKWSALALGSVLIASTLFAGVTFAQLNIPTNLNNAVITIQKILLSPTGTATISPGVTISLDGANGDISTNGNISASGNLTIGWSSINFTNSNYRCGIAAGTSGTNCIIRTDENGNLSLTSSLDGFSGAAAPDSTVFKRTKSAAPTAKNNIYLALDDGTAAVGGKPSGTSDQSFVRIGAGSDTDDTEPYKDDTAMVVGWGIESRGGLYIKKFNNDAEDSNTPNNRTANLTEDYTSLDLNTTEGKVNFRSNNDVGGTNGNTSFIFSADGATTKVGVNTLTPNKALDINGDAVVTDALSVGHASTYDPGTDKLAINGNTRANAYYYNSDRRYKSDIEVLKSPLANLIKISGYSYFNKLSQKQDLGVIAQEVEVVYPELVQTDAEGYKSVQYGNLVAPIIEAIKELATKIDNLFTLYLSQQAKINTLEARLLKLEAQVK
jgi:Chaperone of endosialidase